MLTIDEILGVVIAGLLVVILSLGITVYVEHEQILVARADYSTCKTANKAWEQREQDNNNKLQQIEREDEELAAKVKAAERAAQTEMVKNKTLSDKIKGAKAAPDDCVAAQSLLNQYLGGAK